MLKYCFDDAGSLDNEKFNCLVGKFRKIIYAYANNYYLPGGDVDDLYQWGLLGLYKAVLQYEDNSRHSFDLIARINIKNMIKSAITMANRKKHMAANYAWSLHQASDDNGPDGNMKLVYRLGVDNEIRDPLELIIDNESVQKIKEAINSRLSSTERRIMMLYMSGYKQRYISGKLNFEPKVIDNAIQRARKKLSDYLLPGKKKYSNRKR
ncbi:RNA polymerase sigma-H factor [Sporomusa carbonis]|uniref:sigma-70 family RNA polymerase sigma factor n=1 Tax=Sporomusa carbonis TaxID=3076075 RepID=UPI003A6B6F8B